MAQQQRGDAALAWLRILMGVSIATHGYQKIFGGGIEGFAQGVAQMGFPLPVVFAWAAALSEFAGGLCVAAGFGTRVAAFFVFCTMSVALFIAHAKDPFRTKELAYLYWTIASTLILLGGGRFSVDALLDKGRSSQK